MSDPVLPSTGDFSAATYEQILFAVTGLGADMHAVLDSAAGIGEKPTTWFNFVNPGTAANSYYYRAWDVYYFGVDHNQAAYTAWNAVLNNLEGVSHPLWDGKVGLVDVSKLRDAKTVTKNYVNFLNNSLATTKRWVSTLDTDDAAFKGKAAYAIKVNLQRLAFTFNDLHDQIMEDRTPATPTGLYDAADALNTFAKRMATIWWEHRTFLMEEAARTATLLIENVSNFLAGKGLFVANKGIEGEGRYVLDDFDSRSQAESWIRLAMSQYNSAYTTPAMPAGFPMIDGDLTVKSTWDAINAGLSTYLRTELTKMDAQARTELAKLETAYNRTGHSLGDLKNNPPPTVGSSGGGGGGGGGNGSGGPNPDIDKLLKSLNGNGDGGGPDDLDLDKLFEKLNGNGGDGSGGPDLDLGNGGDGSGGPDTGQLFSKSAPPPGGGGAGGDGPVPVTPALSRIALEDPAGGAGAGVPGQLVPGAVLRSREPLAGARLRRRVLPLDPGDPDGADPDDGWAPGTPEPRTPLAPLLPGGGGATDGGGGAANGGLGIGPGSTPDAMPGVDPSGSDSAFGPGSPAGWSDWSGTGATKGVPTDSAHGRPASDDRTGGMPFFPPMMGGMGGARRPANKERERTTWLSEDEKAWGTASDVGIGVIGRPDCGEPEVDEPLAPTHVHLRAARPRRHTSEQTTTQAASS